MNLFAYKMTVLLALSLGFVCCRSGDSPDKEGGAGVEDVSPSGMYVALVNGTPIRYDEFQACLRHAEKVLTSGKKGLSSVSEGVLARTLLDKMIDAHLLAQHAAHTGIKEPEEEKCAIELDQLMRRGEKRSYFYTFLHDEDLSRNLLLAHFKREWMIDQLAQKLLIQEIPSDDEVKSYYKKNQEKFRRPAKVKLAHIVYKKSKNGESPLQRAMRTKSSLDKGLAFVEAARLYSDDHLTSGHGGRLGWIQQGEMLSRLDQVAFSLKAGEISDPVMVESDVYLLKVIEKVDGAITPFEQVREDLSNVIKKQSIEQHLSGLAKDLRKNAEIKLSEKSLD